MPVYCDKCGHHNRDGAKFCQSCKEELLATEADGTLRPGLMLDKRYEIKRLIKTGGMGSVYEALDHRFQKSPCAVKEMLSTATKSQKTDYLIDRFSKEAKILHDLRHPNLPVVKDYFVESGRYYLVMDYIEGKDLHSVLEGYGKDGVPEELVIIWSRQVLEALHYLHSQIPPVIYRDMKPGNIMLRNSDQRIILIDFGIARTVNPEADTTMTAVGTPAFSPLELFQGRSEPRTDIYSLGATMHCLLTGNVPLNPFCFESVRSLNPDVSEELEAIVMKALQMEVGDRYENAAKMLEDLEKISVKYVPSPPSIALAHSPPTVAREAAPGPGIKGPSMAIAQESTHLELLSSDVAAISRSTAPASGKEIHEESRTEADIDMILKSTQVAPQASGRTEADIDMLLRSTQAASEKERETAPSPGKVETAPAPRPEPKSSVLETPHSMMIDFDEPVAPEPSAVPESAPESDTLSDTLPARNKKEDLMTSGVESLKPPSITGKKKRGVFLPAVGVILVILVTIFLLARPHYKFFKNYHEGMNLSKNGQYEEALNAFNRALSIKPEHPGANNGKMEALTKLKGKFVEEGDKLAEEGRFDEAIEQYDKALEIDSEYKEAKDGKKEAYKKLGDKLIKEEKYAEAITQYKNTEDNGILIEVTQKLYDEKKYSEAILFLNEALSINSEDKRTLRLKNLIRGKAEDFCEEGIKLAKNGNNEKAFECIDKALKINPQYAEAWNAKGRILEVQENYEEAIKAYDEAIKFEPGYWKPYFNKGNVLVIQENLDEAINMYDKAIELDPNNEEIRFNKATVLYTQEKYREAIEVYNKILNINPNHEKAKEYKAYSLKALGQ